MKLLMENWRKFLTENKIADALLSLTLNAKMQDDIGPQVLFKMSDEDLMDQIRKHNHRKVKGT